MAKTLTKDEFVARFVTEMCRLAPFERFDLEEGPEGNGQGDTVKEYAEMTAPTYWDDDALTDESPEECAQADISYWGE